jgi:hypothetical protein
MINKKKIHITPREFRAGFTYTGYPTSIQEPRMDGGSSAVSTPISLAELEAQITELAGHLNAANYRWLTCFGGNVDA